jgi:predicted DNA-binding transcriptional regulator AlpA
MVTTAIPEVQTRPRNAAQTPPVNERRVFNEHQLAQRWGMSPKTLQRWRNEGRGPTYLKLSKRVSYPLDSILAFEHSSLHVSTSERANATGAS